VAAPSDSDACVCCDEDLGARAFRAGRGSRALRRSGLPCAGVVNMLLADGEAAFQEVFHVRQGIRVVVAS
jgi:hypothetical protein